MSEGREYAEGEKPGIAVDADPIELVCADYLSGVIGAGELLIKLTEAGVAKPIREIIAALHNQVVDHRRASYI